MVIVWSQIPTPIVLQGVVCMSRQGPREGYVQIAERPGMQQVFIPSKMAINRAVHGDTVAGAPPPPPPPPPFPPLSHSLHPTPIDLTSLA